jgi:hypothetical protein
LPEPLREWARTGPGEGVYEFVDEELHVAVIPAGNAQGRAFVVFDVAGIEAASSEDWWWLLLITGVVGLLGALGFGLGVLVMRRAVARWCGSPRWSRTSTWNTCRPGTTNS